MTKIDTPQEWLDKQYAKYKEYVNEEYKKLQETDSQFKLSLEEFYKICNIRNDNESSLDENALKRAINRKDINKYRGNFYNIEDIERRLANRRKPFVDPLIVNKNNRSERLKQKKDVEILKSIWAKIKKDQKQKLN